MPMPRDEAWTIRQKMTGVLLRQARHDAGKTLKECGQVLGLSSGAVSAIEHGRRSVSLPELEMLAYYLRVPLERLLDGGAELAPTVVEVLPSVEVLALRHRIIGALLRQACLDRDLSPTDFAKQAGVSARQLSQYEMGQKPIPLVELESLAEVLELPLSHFLEEGLGPIGEQQRRDRESQHFVALPPEVRDFVVQPANLPYLRLAMSLGTVPAVHLRNIAASLLEITL